MKQAPSPPRPKQENTIDEAKCQIKVNEMESNQISGVKNSKRLKISNNHVAGIADLIREWDSGKQNPANSRTNQSALKKSALGNINLDGTASCSEASLFAKGHELFTTSLEPGIRDLVLTLISKLDCITYTSCEGHLQSIKKPSFRERHVGIVSRSISEQQLFFEILSYIAHRTNAKESSNSVYVEVQEHYLTSECGNMPTIEIAFWPRGIPDISYFVDVELVYEEFLSQLHRL